MIQIPLAAIANQSLSINLEGVQYDINVHACRDNNIPGTGIVAFDIIRDSVPIVTGIRAIAGFPILPAKYLEDGNFIVVTANEEYPDWRQFGVTQNLVFVSQTELDTLRATA